MKTLNSRREIYGKYFIFTITMTFIFFLTFHLRIENYEVSKANFEITVENNNNNQEYYEVSEATFETTSETTVENNNNNQIKYIFHFVCWNMHICNNFNFSKCPVNACVGTNDLNGKTIDEFDAIVFNDPCYKKEWKPDKRRAFQKYIFFSGESPVTFKLRESKNFYNWTMTYRKDSDIYIPFGRTEERITDYQVLSDAQLMRKTKLVAWVVSNCRSRGTKFRNEYTKELQKYIPLDIYGRCGTLHCPGKMSVKCYQLLDEKYKFFLAFENSYCRDYISEKTFDILKYTHLVPIVKGFADYNSSVPPHSFIDVNNFESPKHLAEYLIKLANDNEEYKKYFEWKKHYFVNVHSKHYSDACCDLCRKLHEPLVYSWYDDLNKWALGEKDSICIRSNLYNWK